MTLQKMIAALAGYVGARFLGAGLGLLTQIVLARALVPEHVTQVFIAMSAAAFMSLLMSGGETQLASTHLPKLLARDERKAVGAFHGLVLRHLVAVFTVLAVVLAVVWRLKLLPGDVLLPLAVGLATAPFSGFMRYNAMIANSLRWFPLSYIPDFIVRPGLFLAAILIFIALGMGNNVHAVLAAFAVLVWIVAIGLAASMQGEDLKLRHWAHYRARYAKVLRPRSIALLLVSIVSFAFADVVMLLAGFLYSPEDAAIVGVAVRLAAIAGFVLQAGQLFVLPDFTAAMTRRDTAAANAVLWRMNSLTLLIALAGLLGAVLLGRFALSFFGSHYEQGSLLLVLFLVGQSIRSMGGMNQNLLAIGGFQIRTAMPCVLALAVLVGSAVLLVPWLGLTGIGYAVIAAELTWMLVLATQANSLCGRRADLLWLARNAQ
jgi:O-antigen/teichoic acid export membrane protein